MAPKLKGRPRGRRKKVRSDSPSSRIRCDSAGSDSCDSEISACSVEKVYSKYSPLYVKPEFKQGKQVLATRPKLRYNPRPARSKAKSESADGMRSSRRTHSDSSDSNDSDSNTNTTNQDDDDNESSEESEFVQKLIGFHEAHDSQIPEVFWIGLKRINLLSIYRQVKKMGGYEMVTERKMWKYLFGVDGGYNSISRKKYERAILPFEKYEMRLEMAQRKLSGAGTKYYDDMSGEHEYEIRTDGNRRLTESEILEIQRQIKLQEARKEKGQNLHVEMGPGSMPVTVIVGNKKTQSPHQIQIQQPHTTITLHQTTIHPQSSARIPPPQNPIQITNQIQIQQFTVQPGSSDKDGMGGKRKLIDEYSGRDASFVANHLAKLGKTTSLRQVRLRPDRPRDRKSGNSMGHSPPSIGSITVSAIKPNEKENIPYLSGSKTTTITPILGNSNKSLRYPNSVSDIIDLDSENEGHGDSPPPTHMYTGGMFPNMKKRKLDILRQGGLEVTAISNSSGPMTSPGFHGSATTLTAPTANITKLKNNSKMSTQLPSAHVDVPLPKFQSQCMYKRTARIFGNPKDLIPLPTQTTEYNCIDLTVEKCEPTLPIGLRLPQSTTIQKAHSTPALTLPSAALAAQKITDPNLQITLVPPLSHAHNSHNNKRKLSDHTKSLHGLKSDKKMSLPPSITTTPIGNHQFAAPNNLSCTSVAGGASGNGSSSSPTMLNVPNLSTINDNLKINRLLIQNFLNQSAATAQSEQPPKDPSTNPFLMLDPMYLTGLYNNPNLFFQQSLPQELLQLYKNFPQGLGIIPISKS